MSQLHDVFHTSLLRPDPNDPLPGQQREPPAPIRVQNEPGEEEGFHDEWNMEEVLDSRWHYGHLEYKVKWEGFPVEPRKWYRASLFDHLLDITGEYCYGKRLYEPDKRGQTEQRKLSEKVGYKSHTLHDSCSSSSSLFSLRFSSIQLNQENLCLFLLLSP
jgi:hypothetical protein